METGKRSVVNRQIRGKKVKKSESRLLGSDECEQQVNETRKKAENEGILSNSSGGGRE